MADSNKVVRLYGKQDMVKQKTIVDMYSISPHRIYKMEEQGLKRYQLDGKTVFYSIREFESKLKELSSDQR